MQKRIIRIAIVIGLILLIPLFGNFFIEGWNWGIVDFIFAFVMFFIAGLAIDFAMRKITKPAFRIIAITAIVLAFLLIWVELATDAVSRAISSFF